MAWYGPLQPDVTAPGANILAAWSPVSIGNTNGLSVDYNIASGTSMSCPHISAVAAMIKAYHPSWSPAAVKSAIMTTGNSRTKTMVDKLYFYLLSSHSLLIFVYSTSTG